MLKKLPCIVLLLFATSTYAGNDIWTSLFREKLQEAKQGDSEAQYNVGAMYQSGRGVRADRHKASEWYNKAAEQDNQQAISRLGLMKSNEANFSKELQQAGKGNTESQYNLGNMYTRGIGTSIDSKQAISWYEKAASSGHIKAAYKLGLAYYGGTGVRKNGKQAVKWFTVAADKGYAPAQYYLGKSYADGNGVRQKYSAALKWLTRSVDGGFDQARGELLSVTERMKMQTVASKPARVADTDNTPAAKPERAAEKQQDAPVTGGKSATIDTMEALLQAGWNRDNKPVAWLPSAINTCRLEKNRLVCFSDDQTRDTASNTIKFKTRAIISGFADAGTFNITYRNLVIDAVSKESGADDPVAAFDEAKAGKGYTVKTGWGKEHKLECRIKDSNTVNCTKNKTHTMVITSSQQMAGRK